MPDVLESIYAAVLCVVNYKRSFYIMNKAIDFATYFQFHLKYVTIICTRAMSWLIQRSSIYLYGYYVFKSGVMAHNAKYV